MVRMEGIFMVLFFNDFLEFIFSVVVMRKGI